MDSFIEWLIKRLSVVKAELRRLWNRTRPAFCGRKRVTRFVSNRVCTFGGSLGNEIGSCPGVAFETTRHLSKKRVFCKDDLCKSVTVTFIIIQHMIHIWVLCKKKAIFNLAIHYLRFVPLLIIYIFCLRLLWICFFHVSVKLKKMPRTHKPKLRVCPKLFICLPAPLVLAVLFYPWRSHLTKAVLILNASYIFNHIYQCFHPN